MKAILNSTLHSMAIASFVACIALLALALVWGVVTSFALPALRHESTMNALGCMLLALPAIFLASVFDSLTE